MEQGWAHMNNRILESESNTDFHIEKVKNLGHGLGRICQRRAARTRNRKHFWDTNGLRVGPTSGSLIKSSSLHRVGYTQASFV